MKCCIVFEDTDHGVDIRIERPNGPATEGLAMCAMTFGFAVNSQNLHNSMMAKMGPSNAEERQEILDGLVANLDVAVDTVAKCWEKHNPAKDAPDAN